MSGCRLALGAAAMAVAAGCSGETAPVALGEPIRVQAAAFKSGPLPGTPQAAPDAGAVDGPKLTSLQTISGIAFAGQTGKVISGRTSKDAVAIAVRMLDAGSGYWVRPLGVADLLNGGELTFDLHIDFSETVPPGNQKLELVAITADGIGGAQSQLTLCVEGVIPDNFNVCAPNLPPPAAVLSLDWDTPVDLDLQVTTPDGKVVDAKHPTTAPAGSTAADRATAGILDTDAQSGCRAVGPRRENLIWQKPPAPGDYLIRVNLFDACGAASARFNVTVYTSSPDADGGVGPLVAGQRTTGIVLGSQANGGTVPGLKLRSVAF
jgi:hypothetical protein